MPKTSSRTHRQAWLTTYRVFTVGGLIVIAAMVVVLLGRSFMPISVPQVSKVAQATTLLESVGFNNPVYLGVTPDAEGEYPTFRVTAIGGESIELLIRTTPNGGWEMYPRGMFASVASADELARIATQAVVSWRDIDPNIKPRTDDSFGEYESRKRDFDRLAKYSPPEEYWSATRSETSDWPRK